MKDALDELAAKLMDDAADTVEGMRALVKGKTMWSTDEVLALLSDIFRNSARTRRAIGGDTK